MWYLAMTNPLPHPLAHTGTGFTRLLVGLGGLLAGTARPTAF